jgi:hypothetical protein
MAQAVMLGTVAGAAAARVCAFERVLHWPPPAAASMR